MVNMRAVKKLGKLSPGDVFQKTRADAMILSRLGVAEILTEETESVQTAAMKPEPKGSNKKKKSSKKAPEPSRTYRRRDMVAE